MLIPKNRHEYYLAVIGGNDYPTFPPKTREEMYLAKLAGHEADVPIPKTPKERAYYNIISDIKFEPENRWQTFVAAANDDSITAPTPRTREEIWWSNITLAQEVIVEYSGTLPATLQTVAGHLEQYKIYGNTVQNGTPTPENPIEPSGCGVRTANLWDENYENISEILTYKQMNVGNGSFTLSTSTPLAPAGAALFLLPGQRSSGASTAQNGVYDGSPRTVTSTDGYVTLVYRIYHGRDPRDYQTMLNTGSTAHPYEPYGYKLPLTVNGVEYPIYIGDAQLAKEEYVDSETGKIYHNVGGELTPIDPPAPFPPIPTVEGTTIIDYNGEPKPDKVELTYKTIRKTYISADDKVYQDPNGQLLGG